MKILIVDNDKDVLEMMSKMLKLNDHEIDCLDDPEIAIEKIKDTSYDFVLLDFKMPKKDGIWFMKNAEIPRETKVLLITGYVNRDVINQMFALGASGYLIKPFTEEDLLKHLNFHSNK